PDHRRAGLLRIVQRGSLDLAPIVGTPGAPLQPNALLTAREATEETRRNAPIAQRVASGRTPPLRRSGPRVPGRRAEQGSANRSRSASGGQRPREDKSATPRVA